MLALLLALSLGANHSEDLCFLLYQVLLLLLLLPLRGGNMGRGSLLREQLLRRVVKGVRLYPLGYDGTSLALVCEEVVAYHHLRLDVEARSTRGYAVDEILSEGDVLVAQAWPSLHYCRYRFLLVV